MKIVLPFCAFFLLLAIMETKAGGNAPAKADFESFKAFHNKAYGTDAEEAKAKANFEKNALAVAAHNKAFEAGLVSFTQELNQFSDIDAAEFSKQRNGYKPAKKE